MIFIIKIGKCVYIPKKVSYKGFLLNGNYFAV